MQLSQNDLNFYLQCLNEVLHGFTIENFETALGVSADALARENVSLREIERAARMGKPIPQVGVRPNVIKATIDELGEPEFQTRTGYKLSEAEEFLRRLSK
ncbi:MAG: hypothetical protein BGO25_09080 [Acidobacteriales bacterium 59-55]|nr:MAG: hypothetical protein BGO25_09080 [Acidobacteriales bacterium 59-55]